MLNPMLLILEYLDMFDMCLCHIISEPSLIRKPFVAYSWAMIINKKTEIVVTLQLENAMPQVNEIFRNFRGGF